MEDSRKIVEDILEETKKARDISEKQKRTASKEEQFVLALLWGLSCATFICICFMELLTFLG